MAETFTQKDMKMIVDRLAVEAMICGLIGSGETLYYTNGSTGVSATLEVRYSEDGDWKYRADDWLPRFTPKDSKRTQYRMIGSAADALWGVNIMKKALAEKTS